MIEAVVFDLDGVLRIWDGDDVADAERAAGIPVGTVRSVALRSDHVGPAVTGAVADEAWRARVADELTRVHDVDGEALVAAWSAGAGRVAPDVLAAVRDQRRRRRVGILTNGTTALHRYLDRLDLPREVDHVWNSAEIGVAKPDPGVYEYVLAAVGVSASSVAFIDDTPSHVEAASALGIVAHLHTSSAALRTFLDGLDCCGSTPVPGAGWRQGPVILRRVPGTYS